MFVEVDKTKKAGDLYRHVILDIGFHLHLFDLIEPISGMISTNCWTSITTLYNTLYTGFDHIQDFDRSIWLAFVRSYFQLTNELFMKDA